MMACSPNRIQVLLLKTESMPVDGYEEYFSNEPFTPTFVPVLEHRPNVENLNLIHSLLLNGRIGRHHDSEYGGMIFTSQRAVEGFARVVDEVDANLRNRGDWLQFMSSLFPAPVYLLLPQCYRWLTFCVRTGAR
jgi:uroporphyrinogen-III synthase